MWYLGRNRHWYFWWTSIVAQVIGSLVIPIWAFFTMFLLFYALKSLDLLRVSEEEEIIGLDISEHQEEAYAGFQIFTVE